MMPKSKKQHSFDIVIYSFQFFTQKYNNIFYIILNFVLFLSNRIIGITFYAVFNFFIQNFWSGWEIRPHDSLNSTRGNYGGKHTSVSSDDCTASDHSDLAWHCRRLEGWNRRLENKGKSGKYKFYNTKNKNAKISETQIYTSFYKNTKEFNFISVNQDKF